MEPNILPSYHPTHTILSHLEEFKKTNEFSDFLSALKIALSHNLYVPEIENEWKLKKESLSSGVHTEKFFEILPRLEVLPSPQQDSAASTNEESLKASEVSKIISKIFDVNEICKAGAEIEDAEKAYSPRYSWFWPAYEIADVLMEIFPEDEDPGVVIANYIRTIFSEKYTPPIWPRDWKLKQGSRLLELTYDVGLWALDHAELEEAFIFAAKTAMDCIFKPEGEYDIGHLKSIIVLAPLLPMPLFYAWLCNWWLEEPEDFRPPEIDQDILEALLFDPLPLFAHPPKFDFMTERLKKKLATAPNDTQYWFRRFSDPGNATFFPIEALGPLFKRWQYEGPTKSDEKIFKILKRTMERYSYYRWEYCGGASALNASFESHHIKNVLQGFQFPQEETDFTVLLTKGMYYPDDLKVWGDISQSDGILKGVDKSERLRAYLQIAQAAKKEGLPELSSAFLAFFLISQAIAHRGQVGSLHEIVPALNTAMNSPGADLVINAIKVIAQWNQDDKIFKSSIGSELVALALQSLLPEDNKQKIYTPTRLNHLVSHISRIRPAEVEDDIKNDVLGPERWLKLSERSRNFLRDAEMKWRLTHAYLENGMSEWGAIILEYCKVIENELVQRFEEVFCSHDYVSFLESIGEKHHGKPSAGQILRMLRNFKKVSQTLQCKIEAKSNLHNDKKLTSDIYSLVLGYRNRGAHSESMDGVTFTEFRKKYFSGGLLTRFVDSLK